MLKRSRAFLEKALAEKQASAAACLVRHRGEVVGEWYLGSHGYPETGAEVRPVAADTIFDCASVSKALSTVSLLFTTESEGKIGFHDPVRKYFTGFPGEETVLLDLMCHRSGLPAHIEFFRSYEKGETKLGDQKPLLDWILNAGLPNLGTQVYSDLGFMLLGLLMESVHGKPLPEIFHEKIVGRLKLESTGYVTLPHAPAPARLYGLLAPKSRFVATEVCPWRKLLQGGVHDDNCWAFGGYAGHAGVFTTLREAEKLFDHLWKQTNANPEFRKRTQKPPGIWNYGLSTWPGLRPFPGPYFEGALGHTGYTGTNVWYQEKNDLLCILFSNRVHPARTDNRWIDTRLEFHKILWEELGF
ncbi:MAG TPA: serine hydrolase domain-containing protein [Bdellovibrionota bacterium]|jgi:CubicO group peptidase (beta-lactamase class C family)